MGSSSKSVFLALCVLLAVVVFISSDVSAATTDQPKEIMYGNDFGPGNGGGRGGNGGGGGGGGGRGYCRYGCCRRYRNGPGCYRCCSHATEAPDGEFEDDVKN